MKLLFYINILSNGGAERVVANLATLFSNDNYDVVLVTTYETPNEYEVSSNIKRYNLENGKSESRLIIRNIKRIKTLRKIIKLEKPDVIISFMKEANFRALIASRNKDIKKVVSVRNDPKKIYTGKMGSYITKHLLPKANGCVFQTKEAMEYFPLKLQEKSIVILNPISETFYDVKRVPKKGKIVNIGRISPGKNQKILIEAFHNIANKYPYITLDIYGTGYLKDEIYELIKSYNLEDRIFLKGHTDNVVEVLKTADIFVLSSDYEGLPNALMEAMAAGVPCISTDCPCGGPKSLITNKEDGLLVQVQNVTDLEDALSCLLNDDEYKYKLGNNAKLKAESFRPQIIYEEWKNYINNLK